MMLSCRRAPCVGKTRADVLPKNERVGGSEDLVLRRLDCAVIEFMHGQIEAQAEADRSVQRFYSVRGAFLAGPQPYPGTGFKERNHIQVCVRNPNCIKGYFHPLELDDRYRGV